VRRGFGPQSVCCQREIGTRRKQDPVQDPTSC
jgi:hypothetical protein